MPTRSGSVLKSHFGAYGKDKKEAEETFLNEKPEFRAIPLEYMPTGKYEKLAEDGKPSFIQRVKSLFKKNS